VSSGYCDRARPRGLGPYGPKAAHERPVRWGKSPAADVAIACGTVVRVSRRAAVDRTTAQLVGRAGDVYPLQEFFPPQYTKLGAAIWTGFRSTPLHYFATSNIVFADRQRTEDCISTDSMQTAWFFIGRTSSATTRRRGTSTGSSSAAEVN
jgi:hypothetical protein